ncbi:hypothetical protein ACFTZI_26615 [Streptomyces decoyicus]|uniref:hypothetical protein n=1 Tax=Streptomyces decoyicus TaxID=249567 RepID=UPI003643FBE0
MEDGDFGLLVSHAEDSQWEDVIRMAVAHARPRERAEILRGLIARGDGIEDRRARLRVHLLAMACLEHATELDPRVRDEVRERAGAILPPRTREESKLLAEVGPLVLELLPGPEGLEEDEAREVVASAALIGSDAALEVMKRFLHHPSADARHQLAWSWQEFDTDRYAQEIIQHLDADVTVTATSPSELRALKTLGGRPRVSVSGPFTASELLDALQPELIQSLAITENPEITDLAFLREFPSLEWLSLWGCPAVESVAPLADLHIRSLGISGPPGTRLSTPRGLHRLRHTRSLVLYATLPPEGLAALPTGAPLNHLFLGQPSGVEFTSVTRWPQLRTLQLDHIPDDFDERQWNALASLKELERFAFGLGAEGGTLHLPPGLRLPQVRTLEIFNSTRRPGSDLSCLLSSALPTFPGVRKLQLQSTTDAPIGLSLLAALPDLQELRLSRLHPEPGHPLPPHIKLTRYPRPRT